MDSSELTGGAALYETSREIIDVTNKSAGVLRVVEMAGRGRAVVADGPSG